MKTKLTYTLLTALLATSILVGCQKQDNEPAVPETTQIKFNTFLKEGDNIRPLTLGSRAIAGTLDNGFYICGHTHEKPFTTTTSNQYTLLFKTVKIGADGSSSVPMLWSTVDGNKKYYSFQAYACKKSGIGTNGGGEAPANFTNAGLPPYIKSDLKASDDPTQQTDLLGAATYDIQLSDEMPTVNLYFEHRLSRVVMKLQQLNPGGPVLYDVELQITYHNTAPPYSTGVVSWAPGQPIAKHGTNSNFSGTYSMGIKQDVSAAGTETVFAGDLIICPQTLSDAWATVTMTYKLVSGATTTETLKTKLSGVTLNPGEQADYIIGYMVEADQLVVNSVSLTNWTTIDINVPEYK